MKKLITKNTGIDIKGITLLSVDEYNRYKDKIPHRKSWWWLRSPDSSYNFGAGIVYNDGEVGYDYVDFSHGVCPALSYNSESSGLQIGDKVVLADMQWTVISDEYILCDDVIGECPFRKNWESKDANEYEASNVKNYVENWAVAAGIISGGEA